MAGTVTIKDSATTKYVFTNVKRVVHNYEVVFEQYNPSGSDLPSVDHERIVLHTIQVDFELVDKGTYDGGESPGTTGSIWKQKSLVQNLKSQPTNNVYYTLFEDDNDVETSGWNGVVQKIIPERADATKAKMTGTLLFIETDDVVNL